MEFENRDNDNSKNEERNDDSSLDNSTYLGSYSSYSSNFADNNNNNNNNYNKGQENIANNKAKNKSPDGAGSLSTISQGQGQGGLGSAAGGSEKLDEEGGKVFSNHNNHFGLKLIPYSGKHFYHPDSIVSKECFDGENIVVEFSSTLNTDKSRNPTSFCLQYISISKIGYIYK